MLTDAATDPTRSCVGCREKDARDVLLRLIAAPRGPGAPDGGEPREVVPDVRRRAEGRGVSVHPRLRCLEAAVRGGALQRAFRGPIKPSARELAGMAVMQYERRAEGLILSAKRARKLAVGTEAVREAIASHKAQLLVVAHDAEGSREDLERAAARLGRDCLVWNTKQGLGRVFNRTTLSILAVLDIGIADEMRSVVGSAAGLAEDT
jgi:predicted RNA-binding protein YlxR (DUF448 family)/ribosomal protein L30E